MPQLYGLFEHPTLQEMPSGAAVLSGKQGHPVYVAMLKLASFRANSLKEKLEMMLAWVGKGEKLSAREKCELAGMV